MQSMIISLIGSNTALVDANGNCSVNIYSNKTGRKLVIGRVVLNASGTTPASPHTAAAGEWAGTFGGPGALLPSMRDILPRTPGGQMFPQLAEYSGHNALRFNDGEDVYFELRGSTLAAGTQITASIYGILEPTSSDYDI